jgi:tetratricopeptide (TPR) repeat protein
MLAAVLAGCLSGAIAANQRQLDQQQKELDALKQQVVALQAQQAPPSYAATPASHDAAAGGCDKAVMREATRKGGERFAASDFTHALGYYQDAVTACPGSGQAQLNAARAFEAIGDRAQAIGHYKRASQATDAEGADAVRQAREAIARLGGAP